VKVAAGRLFPRRRRPTDQCPPALCTAAGLTALVTVKHAAVSAGSSLCLVARNRVVLLPLTITGLDSESDIYPRRDTIDVLGRYDPKQSGSAIGSGWPLWRSSACPT
jgi:hypothetical protein